MLHSPQILLPPRQGIVAAPPAGFSLVAHTLASALPSPITTSGINTTGATLIVVSLAQYSGFVTAVISDSKSNTWTPLTGQTTTNPYTQLFYCISPVSGAGHTFTATSSSGSINGGLAVQAWNGGTGTFDVQNGSTQISIGSSWQPGSVTPSVNNSLIITGISADSSASSFSINSGFTISDSVNGTPSLEGFGMAYFVQGTAAPINPTWSWITNANVAVTIATFKP